jgi:anti-sigma regulatory factor (Ser/Thr protein kinase)
MRPHQMSGPPPTREAPSPGAIAGYLAGPFEMTLPAALDAPAVARVAVGAWMAGHVSETMRADAQLLVAELVANSVRHADAPADAVVSVRAHVGADVLRLEVEDRGSSGSIARRAPDLQDGGGFGLNLVETLSRRWGVHRDVGTRVWAEIAFPAAG